MFGIYHVALTIYTSKIAVERTKKWMLFVFFWNKQRVWTWRKLSRLPLLFVSYGHEVFLGMCHPNCTGPSFPFYSFPVIG